MRGFTALLNSMQRFANRKFMIPLLAMFAAILVIMEVITARDPLLKKGLPDMQHDGYQPENVYRWLDGIGSSGRQAYLMNLLLDFLFILVFMVLLSLIIAYLVEKSGLGKQLGLVIILPVLRGILDIVENCFMLKILSDYPNKLPAIVSISSMVTVSKFIVLDVIIVVLIGLLVFFAWKTLYRRKVFSGRN